MTEKETQVTNSVESGYLYTDDIGVYSDGVADIINSGYHIVKMGEVGGNFYAVYIMPPKEAEGTEENADVVQ
jgi:hypothetical protein